MRTVSQISRLTGVSVRTLHHYDAVGLLKPTEITEAGYRLYDDTALQRLHAILLYRELQFPLKDIQKMLDSPSFDASAALEQQIALLELERERLDGLITHARALQKKGGNALNFQAFDHSRMEQYKEEAREKWGNTAAWQEFEKKDAGAFDAAGVQMMEIFAELGELKQLPPESAEVQAKVAALQDHITANFYTCSKEILSGLGQMYTADDRFRERIDGAGGTGTAAFAAEAIAVYCRG